MSPLQSRSVTRDSAELTPLSVRLSLLLVVRLFIAAIVPLSAAVFADLPLSKVSVIAAALYAVVAVATDASHRFLTRRTNRRWLFIVNLMLLIDGLFIATVLVDSGQARSAFIFLAYVHVVSVTLLIGFRTGLKIALWHSILLLTAYYLVLAEWLPAALDLGDSANKLTNQLEVVQAIALWLVAIVTATFAALNERELRRRKGELTIVAELTATIERTRRPHEILQALVETTTDKLTVTRSVAVCVYNGESHVVSSNTDGLMPEAADLLTPGGAVMNAATQKAPVFTRRIDANTDPALATLLPEAVNVSIMPLIAEGQVIAILISEWGGGSRRRVTRPMVNLLSDVAGRVALSLSNTFLLGEIQRLASVDALTALPNRRTFNNAIERELRKAERSGQPVSLVMLDIDHFKKVNDEYGHQMGDKVLTESAAGVMGACRGEDLPARYGGEEIAVIMPNCPPEMALAAAERVRAALGLANKTLKGVTASAGVATFPTNASDATGLLAAADDALYRSKEAGRNRATVSEKRADGLPTPRPFGITSK